MIVSDSGARQLHATTVPRRRRIIKENTIVNKLPIPLTLVALIFALIIVSGCATVDATTGASPVEETDADIKDSVRPLERANRVLVEPLR